ncbi:uncharacterized protein LOC106163617 [Lingula anatina]|uniref:Uncharacterized protein LOC106163617 n=1 Tax=Lingula anatina TaxID=7574 RepID=A0A1S3IGW4_LINAN|nr:uncharacterized protein LOC106163617 [Lingula anatina]|eukprot:XP_013396719.1 uncharacterized protein LOC106163617 [Lingula anatina]
MKVAIVIFLSLGLGAHSYYFRPPQGIVNYGNQVIYSNALRYKLQEIANFFGSVTVTSGLRQGGDPHHAVGQAADIVVPGLDPKVVYDRLRMSGIISTDYIVMYHAPGVRPCSTGTHLHIARYQKEMFTGRATCWVIEGTNIFNRCPSRPPC